MKRTFAAAVLLIMCFCVCPASDTPSQSTGFPTVVDSTYDGGWLVASAGGQGDSREALSYMTRTIQGQFLDVLNSYLTPNQHRGTLDLSEYLIPGWSLYGVEMSVASIVAIAERETMGITPNDYIKIQNDTGTGLTTDVLYQEFYNRPHDGKLENYSLTYKSQYYSSFLGDAFLVVRSDYSDPSTNVTGWIIPWIQNPSANQIATHDCSAENAILTANAPYYVVIDGQGMICVSGLFNQVFWVARNAPGLETGYHLRDDMTWYRFEGVNRREAELNYTYTPWNTTSNAPLTYSTPNEASLTANMSSLAGISWSFTDSSNVTWLDFASGQSVRISYDLSLSYRKTVFSSTSWDAQTSGQHIVWNVTALLRYPTASDERFLNVSVPSTWSIVGLYNSTSPGVSFEHYSSNGGTIVCSQLGNETWTLRFTAHNHLSSIDLYQAGTSTQVLGQSRMDYDIDLNASVLEADLDPVSSGSTNLTVWYQGSILWSPANATVIGGATHYLWDISGTVTSNGFYTVEEFWSNGTEAGYRTRELTLYFPTEFGAQQSEIDAYTDSTFGIMVSLNDTFTPQGLDGSAASVYYSFDGGGDTPLADSGNGVWTATISTAGKSPGEYNVDVFAEGYAIENRSLIITANLIHDALPLAVSWSDTSSITYVGSTDLWVFYQRVGGAPIEGAWVNVTIGVKTWNLTYDIGSSSYKITFNGTDSPPGFGMHEMTISAWKAGHRPQIDSSESLTIDKEGTTLVIDWTNSNDITYVESTTLVADFTMSNGSAVVGATVTATIGADDFPMLWDIGTGTYRCTISGSDASPGLGSFSVSIHAELYGYTTQDSSPDTLSVTEEPTTLTISWISDSAITYVESTTLVVQYRMSDLSPIEDAWVNVTIGGASWNLTWHGGTGTYRQLFYGNDYPPGLGTHSLSIIADLYGFVLQTNDTETLTITEESTLFSLGWTPGDTVTYVGQTTLYVTYQMSDSTHISTATVNVSFGATTWNLTWSPANERYEITFRGWSPLPGLGIHDLTIVADLFGFEEQNDPYQTLTITEEPTHFIIDWSGTDNITYVQSTTLLANYSMSNGTSIVGATVVATIGGTPFELIWNVGTGLYEHTFYGSDDPPGLGTQTLYINAEKTGYESRSNSTETLTLRAEPTLVNVGWTASNTITYVGSATLVVEYTTSVGTPIEEASVTAAIGEDTWPLVWAPGTQDYRYTFLGSSDPPGLGTHTITLECVLFGYLTNSSGSASLTITEEPTDLDIQWSNGHDLTYLQSTYILVNYYRMSDFATVQGATVNVTIEGHTWPLIWNSTAGLYTLRFNGSDSTPGVGLHVLTIRAGLHGYMGQTDSAEELTLPEIPTSLSLTWVSSGTITYIQSTILRANYAMFNGTPIEGATVNVTIGGTTWNMSWNADSQRYEVAFFGNQVPPGFGTHSLSVIADKADFVDGSGGESLTITIDPTSFSISWSDADRNITYHGNTTLSVQYLSSASVPIAGAALNATIGTDVWDLVWNGEASAYETTFFGDDPRFRFTTFTVTIRASLFGYESLTDSTQNLTVRVEDTYIVYEWDPSNMITYVGSTVMNIRYLMSNGTPISEAVVNVTIGSHPWDADWNETTQSYQVVFHGADEWLGTGPPYTLFVRASKPNYQSQLDYSQHLTISEEPTSIDVWWSDGNNITYVQQTTVYINYTATNGSQVFPAWIEIRIGLDEWYYPGGGVYYDSGSGLYYKTFYGSDDPPGLGNHGLLIEASQVGFVLSSDNSLTLTVTGELGQISCEWVGDNTITYVEWTILSVNYTMSNGTAIPGATVNVTIGAKTWQLDWDPATDTYRKVFSGYENPPGFGTFGLLVQAWRDGFDYQSDSTKTLTITEEPTVLLVSWTSPNLNNVTYFESTILRVRYVMSNGSDILGAQINATINSAPWILNWNTTSGYYEVEIYGSDNPPGFGTHVVIVRADKYGYVANVDGEETLTLREDPTTISVSWSAGNNITYIQHSFVVINYRMSNGSEIVVPSVNVTIDGMTQPAGWNSTAGAYTLRLSGADDPPGFGTFSVLIEATATNYESRTTVSLLTLREDPASVDSSWPSLTLDWTSTAILSFNYADSSGGLIEEATQKDVYIDGVLYSLLGDNGTYWVVLTNSFDLGLHTVTANISKFGYSYAYIDSIAFTITEAGTSLALDWSLTTVDYLGQIDLAADYHCIPTGSPVPMGEVIANLSIDGAAPIPLVQSGSYWIFNFTGVDLDLGTHDIVIRAWAYGYIFREAAQELTVNEVVTDPLTVAWNPSNITIEYTDSLSIDVQYTFYGGTVPEPAEVNVTVEGLTFALTFSAGHWLGTISGETIGLGLHSAEVRASAYGYEARTSTTLGVNVTQAANSFIVMWKPLDLHPSFVQVINVSVIYTQDFEPILDATVLLAINQTDVRVLTYSEADERWHLSIDASDLGLGVWNMTVTANKTGYADGVKMTILVVMPDTLSITPGWVSESTDYITPVTLQIQINASDASPVLDAAVEVLVDGDTIVANHLGDGLYEALLGPLLSPATHVVNVTVHGTWFYTASAFLSLEVTEAETSQTVEWSDQTIYYTESAVAGVFYSMLNGTAIGGTLEVTLNGTPATASWIIDHWEFDVEGSAVGLGTFVCWVNSSQFGFVQKSAQYVIVVSANPTTTILHDGPLQVMINETSSILLDFEDTYEAVLIDGATVYVEWPVGITVLDHTNGTYEFQLSALGLDSGTYSLNVTLSRYGYEQSSRSVSIDVVTRPQTAVHADSLSQYENETLTVWLQVFDAVASTPLSSANVTASLAGTDYILPYDEDQQRYSLDIWLNTITPGEYEIAFVVETEGYDALDQVIPLTVLQKATYSLALEVTEDVRAGGELTAIITLTEGSIPVVGTWVRVVVVVTLRDGGTSTLINSVETSVVGTGEVVFDIPLTATSAVAVADYAGSVSSWPAESEPVEVSIQAAAGNPLFLILSNPVVLIALAGSGGGVGAVAVRRRRGAGVGRPAGHASTTEAPIPVKIEDSERVQKMIMSTPEGLTRQQISEMTGLSSSKVGEIVRNMVSSDTGFYEWREGTQRLIRYSSEK